MLGLWHRPDRSQFSMPTRIGIEIDRLKIQADTTDQHNDENGKRN